MSGFGHDDQDRYPGTVVEDETQDYEEPESGWRAALRRMSPVSPGLPRPRRAADSSDEPAAMTDKQKREAILGLDPLERKIGLYGALLAALIAVTTQIGGVLNPTKPVSETLAATSKHTCTNKAFTYDKATGKCNGHVVYSLEHWLFALILLLAFSAALFVSVRIGRRGAMGFTALMTGFAFETQVGLLGFPFIAAGGWLLIRAWRVQKYGSPTATKMRPAGGKAGDKPAPAPRAQRPARPKKSKGPVVTGPVANKRYTPKAPKKKRIPATPPES
jgi:hypothetical protein